MNIAPRVVTLETINRKKFRRFIVRYENPETGLLDPTDLPIDDYTKDLCCAGCQTGDP